MTRDVRLEVSEEQHEWLTELKSVAFLPAPRDGVSCLVNHINVTVLGSLDLWLIKFVMEISNISISFDCNKKRTSVNLVLN